jgi:hypothetical protein
VDRCGDGVVVEVYPAAIDLDVTAHVDAAPALPRPARGRIRAGGEGGAQEIGRRISVRPFGRFAMPIHAL